MDKLRVLIIGFNRMYRETIFNNIILLNPRQKCANNTEQDSDDVLDQLIAQKFFVSDFLILQTGVATGQAVVFILFCKTQPASK